MGIIPNLKLYCLKLCTGIVSWKKNLIASANIDWDKECATGFLKFVSLVLGKYTAQGKGGQILFVGNFNEKDIKSIQGYSNYLASQKTFNNAFPNLLLIN